MLSSVPDGAEYFVGDVVGAGFIVSKGGAHEGFPREFERDFYRVGPVGLTVARTGRIIGPRVVVRWAE